MSCMFVSTEIYPYLTLPFLINLLSPDITIGMTLRQYIPQTATMEKTLGEYAEPEVVINYIANSKLRKESSTIQNIITILREKQPRSNKLPIDKIYGGNVKQPVIVTTDEVISFVQDSTKWSKVVSDNQWSSWKQLSKLSKLQLEVIINDDHYDMYERYKMLL